MSARAPYVTTFAEMRRLDEVTIGVERIPGLTLMETAGRAAAEIARTTLAQQRRRGGAEVAVIAGPGNNGGDGYVLARYLAQWGHRVTIYLVAPLEKVRGDARANLDRWLGQKGNLVAVPEAGALALQRAALVACDLIVDALFGTGLTTHVRSPYREAIEVMNALGKPILALDVASGVDGDTGRVLEVAVRATLTVAFGFAKRAHYLFPAAAHTGALHVVDIGIPEKVVASNEPRAMLVEEDAVSALFPPRVRDAHKGTFGHVLVAGGAKGRTGAALLASRAALRSGAGLCTIAAPDDGRSALDAKVVEVMTEALGPVIDARAAPRFLELAAKKSALVVGPGLGAANEGLAELLAAVLPELAAPAVLDADALGALAQSPSLLRTARSPIVITPHPGEMARLLGLDSADVQADRFGHAERFAAEHGVVVVLKGANTIVAGPSGRSFVVRTGNPGMATGGTGDALAGVIGAFLAAGLSATDAARAGAFVHGLAGDLAKERFGEMGLVAGDLVDALPEVYKRWSR